MVDRGHCKFTTKANVAEAANASAVLIINNQKGKQTIYSSYISSVCAFSSDLKQKLRAWLETS